MAVLVGNKADIYIATGAGTAMTGEATTSLGGGVYQITSSTKRAINPNAAVTVYDGATPVATSDYQLAYGSGKIRFSGYTPSGAVTVDGEYLTLSQAAQGTDWTLDVQPTLEEVQVFGDTWRARACVQADASVTFNRFYNDDFFPTNGGDYFVLALYLDVAAGSRYVLGATLTSTGVTTGENETIKEAVSFSVHGIADFVAS
jgi:hypothetical protein